MDHANICIQSGYIQPLMNLLKTLKNLAYILLFIPFGILSQNIDFTAKASKNKIVIGEPSTITLEFKFPANQLIDSVEFQLSSSGDSLGNNWELWDKSI